MAQTTTNHKTHILDFTYDNEDASALTVLINDVRFHIAVNPKELQKSREKPLYYEYLDKISALREAEEREGDRAEERQAKIRSKKRENSEGKDSGIDVTSSPCSEYEEEDDETGEDEDQDSGSAGVELRTWILSAFADITRTYAPPNREPVEATVYEWYHGPTYFYHLLIANSVLLPELLETTTEREKEIEDLVPRMRLPKYIQSYPLPWLSADDLLVQNEVSMPSPAHPGTVLHKDNGAVYFFKPVVPDQPDSVKREIQILRKLEKLDLHVKAPRLLGLVRYGKSKTEAMGLLLDNIEKPTPLTKLLSSKVDEDKRAEWSEKSEEYVRTLHENGIVWGDAKADNFIVDAKDELWIIDFGGSYTEGWVDPEISETVEGDAMGLEKIQAALQDPEKNMIDLGLVDDDNDDEVDGVKETASSLFVTEKRDETRTSKRKRAEEEIGSEDGDPDERGKKRKSSGAP
jgi:tRNA A-37 threonylcarbamoyl transferase component Bud32